MKLLVNEFLNNCSNMNVLSLVMYLLLFALVSSYIMLIWEELKLNSQSKRLNNRIIHYNYNIPVKYQYSQYLYYIKIIFMYDNYITRHLCYYS